MTARIAISVIALLVPAGSAGLLEATGTIDLFGRRGQEPATDAARVRASAAAPKTSANPTRPAVRRRLKVITHPSRATLRITTEDGAELVRTTPFTGRILEGDVTLTLSRRGYNRLTERVTLDRARSLELWLDPRGLLHHKLGTLKTGAAPKQVALSPDGQEIWVTLLGGAGVEVFDTETRRRLATIDLGKFGAVEVIFSRDGSTAYVSQMETASVFEIDTDTRRVRRRLPTRSAWSKVMALSPNERILYVANWSGHNVSEIRLRRGKVRRQIPTVDTPRGLYVSPDGKRLFVAGFENGELERINLVTGKSKVLSRTGGAMRHVVGDPTGDRVYASDMGTDEVYVVDLATETVRRLAKTDHKPNTIDLTPDGKVLYVSNRGENNPTSYYLPGPEWGSVLAIDTATGRILDAIVGGNQTTGLDVSADGRLLAYSDFLDNRVTLFEIPRFETLARGDGGRAKEHLAELKK